MPDDQLADAIKYKLSTLEHDLSDIDSVVEESKSHHDKLVDVTMKFVDHYAKLDADGIASVLSSDTKGINFSSVVAAANTALSSREKSRLNRFNAKIRHKENTTETEIADSIRVLVDMRTKDIESRRYDDNVSIDDISNRTDIPEVPKSALKTDPMDFSPE